MEIHVDRVLCENHGQCVIAAPEVFRLDGDQLEYEQTVGLDAVESVEDAADMCPVLAIELYAQE